MHEPGVFETERAGQGRTKVQALFREQGLGGTIVFPGQKIEPAQRFFRAEGRLMIAEYTGDFMFSHFIDYRFRVRSVANEIAKTDDSCGRELLEIGHHRIEGFEVPVDV